MNTFVVIIKVEAPEGVDSMALTARLHGAGIEAFSHAQVHVAQIVKVVDVVPVFGDSQVEGAVAIIGGRK